MRLGKLTVSLVLFLLIVSAGSLQAEDRRIIAGDIINITVLGYPELSKSVVVRQDGTIEYPLLSNVPIIGMTQLELRELLFPVISRYVERPQLFLYLAEFSMVQFAIQGQVNNPGTYTVQGPLGLQSAISIGGGVTENANLNRITLIRKENFGQAEIQINLYDYFNENKSWSDLTEIKSGDVVIIPTADINTFIRIMGAVNSPGTYLPLYGGNIADMINLAGGAKYEGNLDNIIYITHDQNHYTSQKVRLKKIIEDGLEEAIPLVKPGDIIIVNEYSDWSRFSWWVTLIRDFAIIASTLLILKTV